MSQQKFEIVDCYKKILREDEEISMPIAAILSLTCLIEHSKAGTMFELVNDLNTGKETLKASTVNNIGLSAGAELFTAYVTSFPHESTDFLSLKRELIKEGRYYSAQSNIRRLKISAYALKFIKDGAVILTHSYSRVVVQTLLHAHRHRRLSVLVTEACPNRMGSKTAQILQSEGIPTTLILDSSVGYFIDKVDMVLVGSEAVLESGGVVNAVGSYQIALIAKAAHKPFYAVSESYKFHRQFPLTQYDLPSPDPPATPEAYSSLKEMQMIKIGPAMEYNFEAPVTDLSHPEVDYTRPDLISLVFTDVGVLTPSGVSQYLVGMFAG